MRSRPLGLGIAAVGPPEWHKDAEGNDVKARCETWGGGESPKFQEKPPKWYKIEGFLYVFIPKERNHIIYIYSINI